MNRLSLCSVILVLGVTAAAMAQTPEATFVVTPMGGYGLIDEASALDPMAAGGIDAIYRHSSGIVFGIGANAARAKTQKDFFPRARLVYGQRTELYDVQQPVFVYAYRAQAGYHVSGRLAPYVLGGVGGYAVYTDPEQSRGGKFRHALHFAFGGGIDLALEERTGLRLDIRDLVYTDWDREMLNPVAPEFRDDFFPEFQPAPPEPKDMIHNIVISIGFNFVP
ncbi:MAG: porin family protein [Gemmatimonadetes bacterium]|nr:porin family protein [Gemmatimonadota bacterium]